MSAFGVGLIYICEVRLRRFGDDIVGAGLTERTTNALNICHDFVSN